MIDSAFAPAAAAVAGGRVPGAALGIVRADGRRSVRLAGMAALVPEPEPLTEAHWFDLASLTKVIATTTMILRLAEEGRIGLDRPLTDAIPDLRQYDVDKAPERRLTFRDCLGHRTFLPAVEPIYTYGNDPARLRAFVLQREWRHGPPVYSDINFILLGIAVERITGRPLADWSLAEGLSWGPPPGPAVATEACTWRGRVLRGEVHDENASALGGAAGHAGLFGTVGGVLDFALGLLDGSGASPAMIEAIRTPVRVDRTCGWEIRFDGWHGGGACSASTIGHTGFTGTGLWVDFDRGLAWTLLTNRVHPTRHRESGIAALRRATGDAVAKAWRT
ncbi:MAG TPA: serine hydrolase domain-containing protein [Allosphingosinicella sp.]|jgi:CubicO group peptidase (beta-lactamase class C family)